MPSIMLTDQAKLFPQAEHYCREATQLARAYPLLAAAVDPAVVATKVGGRLLSPFPGGRRIAARSWASIGRVRQRFDFSDRRRQSARLKNIGCELRHHRIGPDFGADAFDLDKEL